jgi:hypothetical protein
MEGWVHVELDQDGRLEELVLDPRVTQLSVDELRLALIAAFTRAQDSVWVAVEEAASSYAGLSNFEVASAEVTEQAERRFAEISTALFDLSRRAGQRW